MGLGDLVLETLKKVVDYIIELADDFGDVLRRGIQMTIEKIEMDVSDLRANLESVREQVEKLMRVYVKE